MRKNIWTAEELESMRRFDEMVDSEPMTERDYKQVEFDDELCFPELQKKKEKTRIAYARQKEAKIQSGEIEKVRAKSKKYAEENKEKIKARRAAYYQANKERIAAHQKDYRKRKKADKATAEA